MLFRSGCRAIGYELNEELVLASRKQAKLDEVASLASFEQKDIFKVDLSMVDVATLYLLPRQNAALIPRLNNMKPGSRIVAHEYAIPGVKESRKVSIKSADSNESHTLYLYTTPLNEETNSAPHPVTNPGSARMLKLPGKTSGAGTIDFANLPRLGSEHAVISDVRKPTHADIKYGDHERHVIDLYLVESEQPTPLVIYIHGGGFVGGDKRGVSGNLIRAMHKESISVAAIHYRFIREHPFPAPFIDSARAVQFLRQHAKKYNLDSNRFAASGGSAGAGISLWLATRDDMAEPKSDDPTRRESTRISCAPVGSAQVSYAPRFWKAIGLAKGLQHPRFPPMFRVPADSPFDEP